MGHMMKVELPAFAQASVLIVGDIMLDRYWSGVTQRISPEAPVPIVRINNDEDRPGGAANVALNIASLGGKATLIGITGEDQASDILMTKLQAMNIDCNFVKQAELPTITKLRVMSRNQQLIRLDFEELLHELDKSLLQNCVEQQISQHQLLLLSDYDKGTLSNIAPLIALAKKHQVPVVVDPKGHDFSRYRGATLLTPNMSEFEAVVGVCQSETQLVEKGQLLLTELDLSALLITRSEHGMTLLRKDLPELHLPTQAKEVFDVTGAGDTVIATLSLITI